MSFLRTVTVVVVLLLILIVVFLLLTPESSRGQETGRIWGLIETTGGQFHEGFIRWDRNEAAWVDLLNGTKELEYEAYLVWNDSEGKGEVVPDRIIEIGGVRISFPDGPGDNVTSAESGIRFGHIERMVESEGVGAELFLRSGGIARLQGDASDLGPALRDILVEVPGKDPIRLGWRDFKIVSFRQPPGQARPSGRRLHGTVEDHAGHRYTGYIAWGTDQTLTTDSLVGEEPGGATRELPFVRVETLQPTGRGATVTMVGGESLDLSGTEDVSRANDGIQISDPGLGQVEVEWRELTSVRFHEPAAPVPLSSFDGGHPLRGTVVTASGHELTGGIRWDADEEYSWEMLDGERDGVVFDVEFGKISHIERFVDVDIETESVEAGIGFRVEAARIDGVRVTLRDGRVLELEGSNDVNRENKGIFVRPDSELGSGESGEPEWIMVRWEDFRELRLDHEGGS
jgi:hypothetical protein